MFFLSQYAKDLSLKRVLIRLDLNVPIDNSQIRDITRIEKIVPTLHKILEQKPKQVVIISHLGRPKQRDINLSLEPVAVALEKYLKQPVIFQPDSLTRELKESLEQLPNGSVVMLENIRFYPGEESNDAAFSKLLSDFGDVFVNEAFSCSHRAHASIVGVTEFLPSYAGLCLEAEIQALESILKKPNHPILGIVGGSKVSTKIDLLLNLLEKMDYLFVGGGIANTLLNAQGYKMGASLVEHERLGIAHKVLEFAKTVPCELILPTDVRVAHKLVAHAKTRDTSISDIASDEAIYDIGEETTKKLLKIIDSCETIVWNSPVGVYEVPPFADASLKIAEKIADVTRHNQKTSIAGGGDTIALLGQAQCLDKFSYVSTAGGAFLEWLEGKILPGIACLEHQKNNRKLRSSKKMLT